ncbi:MAG: MFS transporter [Deltaproteobacteria bacterium]|uniref:MFS transporter n=1 Tax=Candidatus Zymogenus saltonus TaxID=2844893 RepID=A0A9D8KDP8_9DELT|nr:MFS transporter [Candidatus Zymogenus saltonus]
MQLHWITFAPITIESAEFYGVDELWIGMLSLIFMAIYIFMSIPASAIVDKYGIRIGVGIGAFLTGIFGLMKGLWAESFVMVFVAQAGISVAQPFILNSVTSVAVKWFPIKERATAAGISMLGQLLGVMIAMALTPFLFKAYDMKGMLMIYGVATVAITVLFLGLMREKPPTSPDPEGREERHTVFEGLKHILKQKDMIILIFIFFLAMGMFNAITTWIERILAPRGFTSDQAGIVGAIMLVGGILGAIVFPTLSDRKGKRKFFMLLAIALITPGLIGLTFATNYTLLLISSFVFGFFFLAAGPIGFQYSAEVSHPAPEATSQGLLVLSAQISGILFIFGMDMFTTADGSMTPFMLAYVGMMILNIVLAAFLKESEMIKEPE